MEMIIVCATVIIVALVAAFCALACVRTLRPAPQPVSVSEERLAKLESAVKALAIQRGLQSGT